MNFSDDCAIAIKSIQPAGQRYTGLILSDLGLQPTDIAFRNIGGIADYNVKSLVNTIAPVTGPKFRAIGKA